MFNSYSSGGNASANNSIKINAVSGNILKNYPKSFFVRFSLKSEYAERIFNEENSFIRLKEYPFKEKSVVVIQIMMCGEMSVIAEVMWKEDFDNLFK